MRNLIIFFIVCFSPISISSPIKYSFEGYTNYINLSSGNHDSDVALVRDDGFVVTNGNSSMNGHIIFDPAETRNGAGGTGLGEVLSWSFTTQGLTYHGAGGGFHYLTFNEGSFKYHDEVPEGGYGPDVASMSFNFNGEPFALGPDAFPIEDFIGGSFFTAIDLARISDDVTMYGLEGEITKLQVSEWSVPSPPAFWLMVFGLLGMVLNMSLKPKQPI